MLKLIIITFFNLTLLASFQEELKLLKSRVLKLENQNRELSDTIKELKKEKLEEIESELYDLDERVEDVETHSFKDKLALSLGFKSRVDGYKKSFANNRKFTRNGFLSTKFMLNLRGDISKNMNIFARASMYKYWDNESKVGVDIDSIHSIQGKYPSDSKIYLERAYVNWLLNPDSKIKAIFTIGRLPTSEGPSYQFMDDSVVKSNYPASLFETNSDGAVLSLDFKDYFDLRYSALRFFYSKLTTNYQLSSSTYGMFKPIDTFSGDESSEDSELYAIFLESSIPNIESSYFQLSYMYFNNKKTIEALRTPTCSHPDPEEDDGIIGEFILFGSLVEFQKFLNSDFDIFAHLNLSKTLPDKWLNEYLNVKSEVGYNYWFGVRYNFPNFKLRPKIGFEYNYGSRDWFNSTFASHDLTNKLITRGSGYELYYIQPINEYSNFRVGALYLDYKYSGSGSYRGGVKIDSLAEAKKSTMLDSLVNYYLQFNVNY